jgi:hypothetical protein
VYMYTIARPIERLRLRTQISLLQLSVKVIRTKPFRWLLRLVCRLALYGFAFMVVFGYKPKIKPEPASQLALEWDQIQKLRDAPVDAVTDRYRDTMRAMTWGTAVTAVLILTAIATNSKPSPSTALQVAAALFALATPFLIMLGVVFNSHADAKEPRPTWQQTFNITAAIYGTQFVFGLGIVALLWSFDWRVAVAFLIAVYFAWRCFKGISKRYVAKVATAATKPEGSLTSR